MAFQSTVGLVQGFGVVGEVVFGAPRSAQPGILNSTSAANNVVGRVFTIDSGDAVAGGTGAFLGFLISPKEYASRGTQAGGPLAATLTLANGEIGSFLQQGQILVDVGGTASVGDLVVYDAATGILDTIAPDDYLPAGHQYAYAHVTRADVGSNGLAVVSVNYVPTAPVAA